MKKHNYDIAFSNGMVVTVLLTDQHPVTLSVKLPSGKKVKFSHDPHASGKKRTIQTAKGLVPVKSTAGGGRRSGGAGGHKYLTLTDTASGAGSALSMRFGDPEDPIM